jgi:hypothetical protein
MRASVSRQQLTEFQNEGAFTLNRAARAADVPDARLTIQVADWIPRFEIP